MGAFDAWQEVFDLIRRNKVRTFLTALSVAWGIFMLIILLAAGRGLQQGVEHDFRDDATNSIWIRPAETSLPFAGRAPGRTVRFKNTDVDAVAREVGGVEHITGRFYLWGDIHVSRGNESERFGIRGCHPDHLYLERTIMLEGRFINETDVERRRKVAVIGPEVKKALFRDEPYLGQYIRVKGVPYQVVGLYRDEGQQNELRKIYIPITTAQLVYRGGEDVHHIMFTTGDATVEQSKLMESQVRHLLAARHDFDVADWRAINISNNLERFRKMTQMFGWVEAFVWLVGIGTILAGVIGVSNIMLISVRERTTEIGIRKAIGATPWQIVRMVLMEAFLVTSVSGYSGLVLGALVVELVQRHLPDNDYLRNPQVDFRAALIAVIVLVVAGVLAGLVPALRAAKVQPVTAMREG